jgi:hypothetical protein
LFSVSLEIIFLTGLDWLQMSTSIFIVEVILELSG